MSQYIAGIDIGTTGAKTIIFDLDGNKKSSAYREYKCFYPNPNWVEQDPEELVEAALASCKEAVASGGLAPTDIVSVGFSVQRCCGVFLDEQERPMKMISWQDNRAAVEVDEIAGMISAQEFTRVSGLPLSTTWLLPKLLWVKKHDPQLWGKTHRFVQLHDYLLRCLGADNYYLSETDAGFFGCWEVSKLEWNKQFLDTFGLDPAKISQIRETGAQVGVFSKEAAEKSGLWAGIPLCVGPGDQSSAALGAGVVHPGDVSVSLGTGGMCIICLDEAKNDPNGAFFTTNHVIHGLWQWEGLQNASAGIYRWFRDEVASLEYAQAQADGLDVYDKLSEMAATVPAGARGLVVLPYYASAATPRWNSNARGTILGLTFAHDKACLARAFMEGIVMEHRDMMESVLSTGGKIGKVRIMGGPTRSEVWNQIQADIYGVTVETLKIPDASVLGAAITGAVGSGVFSSFEAAVERLVRVDKTYQPIPKNVEAYARLYQAYRAAYDGLAEKGAFDLIASFQNDLA